MGTDLKVGDIMTRRVIVVPLGDGILNVAKLMKKHSIGSVIVVDAKDKSKAKGIITERDIVDKIIASGKDPYKLTASTIMSKPLRVVRPDTTLEDAANAMRENKVKRLPVVNQDSELVGILSESDLMRIFPAVVDLIEERSELR